MNTKNKIKIETTRGETEYDTGMFTNRYGSVWFRAEMLPSCCGVTVLHDFAFRFNYTKHTFFKTFHKWLVRTKRFNINRTKLLISATEGSDLDEFCIYNKWKGDEAQLNKKSGNMVIVYTLARGIRGDRY